ncbi:TPA: hypothetical protein QB292_000001, partial [Pasteurella multocida]|nr:hypothetical protein [Pasteurella multocida]
MRFRLLNRDESMPQNAQNLVCLLIDNWNDYSYITMFFMSFFDSDGVLHEIGNIKIGFKGQVETIPTHAEIKNRFDGRVFDKLPDNFISLGQDVD